MTRKTHVGWVKALLQSFESKGFSRAQLLHRVNIDDSVLLEQDAISQDQITDLWDAASDIANSTLFGLETGEHLPVNALGPISYALMSCQTLGESFSILVNYQHIIADALALSVNKNANMTELVFNNIGDKKPSSYHAIDAAMSAFKSYYEWILRSPLPLSSVHFLRENHSLKSEYQAFFNCKVRFAQNNNSLWLQNAALETPLATADATMAALHKQALKVLAKEKANGDFRRTVADIIRQNLMQPGFGLEQVAARLFMSKSSLQRKLKNEKVSFQTILDETREYQAIALLRQTSLSVAQISERLGFADPGGFTRTFKKWTGRTPKEYRL